MDKLQYCNHSGSVGLSVILNYSCSVSIYKLWIETEHLQVSINNLKSSFQKPVWLSVLCRLSRKPLDYKKVRQEDPVSKSESYEIEKEATRRDSRLPCSRSPHLQSRGRGETPVRGCSCPYRAKSHTRWLVTDQLSPSPTTLGHGCSKPLHQLTAHPKENTLLPQTLSMAYFCPD